MDVTHLIKWLQDIAAANGRWDADVVTCHETGYSAESIREVFVNENGDIELF